MEGKESVSGLVSVVIPVYNVEKYLRECADSVLGQSYRNIEVILVNDGSTDGSPKICNEYLGQDSRVRVIHQENKGLSAARNRGLDQACGEYIYFLDSDDYLASGAIQKLYGKADVEKLDVLLLDSAKVDEAGVCYNAHRSRNGIYKGVYDGRTLFAELTSNRDYRVIAQLLFIRRSFLLDVGLRFYEGILHEDVPFTFLLLLQCQRGAYLPEPLMCKRARRGSIMTTPQTGKNVEGCLCGLEEMAAYYSSNSFVAVVSEAVLFHITYAFWNTYTRCQKCEVTGKQVDSSVKKRLFTCMKELDYLNENKIARRCRFNKFYSFFAKIAELTRRVARRFWALFSSLTR